jgi:hypothetical protein
MLKFIYRSTSTESILPSHTFVFMKEITRSEPCKRPLAVRDYKRPPLATTRVTQLSFSQPQYFISTSCSLLPCYNLFNQIRRSSKNSTIRISLRTSESFFTRIKITISTLINTPISQNLPCFDLCYSYQPEKPLNVWSSDILTWKSNLNHRVSLFLRIRLTIASKNDEACIDRLNNVQISPRRYPFSGNSFYHPTGRASELHTPNLVICIEPCAKHMLLRLISN